MDHLRVSCCARIGHQETHTARFAYAKSAIRGDVLEDWQDAERLLRRLRLQAAEPNEAMNARLYADYVPGSAGSPGGIALPAHCGNSYEMQPFYGVRHLLAD